MSKHTDISFTYKTIKEGRKVSSIEFSVKENKVVQQTVTGALAKKYKFTLKNGDRVEIAGREYVFDCGIVRLDDGVIPQQKIEELIRIGKAVKK